MIANTVFVAVQLSAADARRTTLAFEKEPEAEKQQNIDDMVAFFDEVCYNLGSGEDYRLVSGGPGGVRSV